MASVMINEKGNYQLMVFCLRKKEYIFVEFDTLDALCIQENLHSIEHFKKLRKETAKLREHYDSLKKKKNGEFKKLG